MRTVPIPAGAPASTPRKPIRRAIPILVLGLAGVAAAPEGHDHGAAPHGGTVAKTRRYEFEVVIRKEGLNVYPVGQGGTPVEVSKLTGTATFTLPGAPKPFVYPLKVGSPSAGQAQDSLGLAMDLSKVPVTGSQVAIRIGGLPDPAEATATFTVPFAPSAGADVTFAKATQADAKAIAAQKVCKVSGEALGSMGGPIKATRGDSSTFLCCAACEKKLLAEPDKYLAPPVTAVKATKADESAISAQKVCPVSGEALGSTGTPVKVTRGSRTVFLCCQDCLKKVAADPDKFLGATAAAR